MASKTTGAWALDKATGAATAGAALTAAGVLPATGPASRYRPDLRQKPATGRHGSTVPKHGWRMVARRSINVRVNPQ